MRHRGCLQSGRGGGTLSLYTTRIPREVASPQHGSQTSFVGAPPAGQPIDLTVLLVLAVMRCIRYAHLAHGLKSGGPSPRVGMKSRLHKQCSTECSFPGLYSSLLTISLFLLITVHFPP